MRNTQQNGNHNQLSSNEKIINRTNERKRKNRRKKLIIRSVLGFLCFVIGVFAALMLFFNITEINVTGDEVYGDAEIIKISQIQMGDNLIFLSESKLNEKITVALPYIDSVKIKRHLPSRLEIIVTKTDGFMAVSTGGYYTLLDKNGKVLEKGLETVGENIMLVNLGTVTEATVGKTVVLENEKTLEKLSAILLECDRLKLENISEADLSDLYNIKLVYEGRITLELGETDDGNLNKKIALGKAAIEEQDEENSSYRGTINLTVDGKGYWSVENTTTEPPTEAPTEVPTTNDGATEPPAEDVTQVQNTEPSTEIQ